MPENTTTNTPAKPDNNQPGKDAVILTIPDITVSRNNTSEVFKQAEYKRGDKKKGTYPTLSITKDNLPQIISFVGNDIVAEKLGALIDTKCQQWWESALDTEGVYDEATEKYDVAKATEVFTKYAESFSASGEPMEVLEAKEEEKLTELKTLAASDVNTIEEMQALKAKMQAIKAALDEIATLKAMRSRGPRKKKATTEGQTTTTA